MYLAEKITWDLFSPKKKTNAKSDETKRNETGGDPPSNRSNTLVRRNFEPKAQHQRRSIARSRDTLNTFERSIDSPVSFYD